MLARAGTAGRGLAQQESAQISQLRVLGVCGFLFRQPGELP
jgi:hypothetical protein